MENKGIKYEFTTKVWNYSSTVGTGGWHIACLPKEMSKEIRENLGFLEEGWGKNCALEMVQAGGVVTYYDKLIDRQLERAAVTCTAGFSKIFTEASKVMSC